MGGPAWIFVSILIGYSLLCAALFFFQRKVLYRPEPGRVVPTDWNLSDFITVTVETRDGLGIDSWYLQPPQSDGEVIVVFPGNSGHLGRRALKARAFAQAGYGVLLAGYRGFSGNPGEPTEQGLYHDARAALDFLVSRGISGRRLVLYGEFLGCSMAVQMASERRVGAVVLEGAHTSITDVANIHYPFLPVSAMLLDRFRTITRIRQILAPLLILHGECDRTVPVRIAQALFAAAAEPKKSVWFPEGDHTDLWKHGALDEILSFLKGLRPGSGPPPATLDQAMPQVRRNLPAVRR
jgi:uncharacterized protein